VCYFDLQETQSLLARLSQPSAAALHNEYDNIQRLTSFLNSDPAESACFDQITPGQLSSTLQRWCVLAKPFLQVLVDQADQITRFPAAFSAVGMLLNALGNCLEVWVRRAAAAEEQTLMRQIARHAAGKCRQNVARYMFLALCL
jgi:predicted transcriptional regulator